MCSAPYLADGHTRNGQPRLSAARLTLCGKTSAESCFAVAPCHTASRREALAVPTRCLRPGKSIFRPHGVSCTSAKRPALHLALRSQSAPPKNDRSNSRSQRANRGVASLFSVTDSNPWLYRPPPAYCRLRLASNNNMTALDGRIDYLGPVSRNKIALAIELAATHSLPLLFAENLSVAGIVADMGMDVDTVCAAILRGFLHKREDIISNLGTDVATILDLHQSIVCVINSKERALATTSSNLPRIQQLMLLSTIDHRAISVELAAAVVATRSLDALPAQADKILSARRAIHLYAPIASQLGMYFVQSELEELGFLYLRPQAFHAIRKDLAYLTRESQAVLRENKHMLDRILSKSHEIRTTVRSVIVRGRIKGVYSCFCKLQRTGKPISDMHDLLALRVIVQAKAVDEISQNTACYAVSNAVCSHFTVLPAKSKDYIAKPKPNGYRSIHLTVLTPSRNDVPVEIQIRTDQMHRVAEFGAAAHWMYKMSDVSDDPDAGKANGSLYSSL